MSGVQVPDVQYRPATWVRVALLIATLGPTVFWLIGPDLPIPWSVRGLAVILWVLTLLPTWVHALQRPERRTPIPFIQIIGLLFGLYYAIPVIFGVYNQGIRIVLDPGTDFDQPVTLALLGWGALLVGYYGLGSVFAGKVLHVRSNRPLIGMQRWGFVLLYGGILVSVLTRFVSVPNSLRSVLHLSHSLTLFGAGLLVVLAVRKELAPHARQAMYAGILAVAAIQVGTGLISNLAFLGATVFLAVWLVRGYMGARWIAAAVAGIVLVVALKAVTQQYRQLAWYGDRSLSGVQGASLMLSLLTESVQSEGVGPTLERGMKMLSERSSAMDLLADVVDRTPREIPYLNGQTYLSLVGVAIPRVLWPTKPTKNIGQRFGHTYGYLDYWDAATSVNCPYLVEFYFNYGYWGVMLGMFLVGLIYRGLRNLLNNPGQSPLVSLMGLTVLVPLLNIESDFSLTFGGLLMNGIALWLVFRVIRSTDPVETGQWAGGAGGGPVLAPERA